MKAKVILFKPEGKYYTEEEWEVPTAEQVRAGGGMRGDLVGPFCMTYSPDFHAIAGGPVLVPSQEPWGYPFLITAPPAGTAAPVTGQAPLGMLAGSGPAGSGLTVWECALCGSLINDTLLHGKFHAER